MHFRGVQKNLNLKFLDDEAAGWTKHVEAPYSHHSSVDELREIPKHATHVFVGARKAEGAKSVALAAIGERRVVVPGAGGGASVGSTTRARAHNGAFWYCVPEHSFGFAPSANIALGAADTTDSGGRKDGDRRLSWHICDAGGYRAGKDCGLDGSDAWLKLVYYRAGGFLRPTPALDPRCLARLGVPRDAGGRRAAPASSKDKDKGAAGDAGDDDDDIEPAALAMSACSTKRWWRFWHISACILMPSYR